MKISLSGQIDEVAALLAERRRELPRLVAQRKIRDSVATYQLQRLEAVLATLIWLQEHERLIKQRLAP